MAVDGGGTSVLAPGGKSTPRNRSSTCWRASWSPGLSSKVIIENISPYWVWLNNRTVPGMPVSATSMGSVTCFSTSSAARPGYSAMTLTWVSETSGKASTGRFWNASEPAPTKIANPSPMNSG